MGRQLERSTIRAGHDVPGSSIRNSAIWPSAAARKSGCWTRPRRAALSQSRSSCSRFVISKAILRVRWGRRLAVGSAGSYFLDAPKRSFPAAAPGTRPRPGVCSCGLRLTAHRGALLDPGVNFVFEPGDRRHRRSVVQRNGPRECSLRNLSAQLLPRIGNPFIGKKPRVADQPRGATVTHLACPPMLRFGAPRFSGRGVAVATNE